MMGNMNNSMNGSMNRMGGTSKDALLMAVNQAGFAVTAPANQNDIPWDWLISR